MNNVVCVGTNFVNARFDGAMMRGTDFRTAKMDFAHMQGATLGGFDKALEQAAERGGKGQKRDNVPDR